MSLKEKVAYLKGLSEGLGFDSESKEGKLFSAVIDALSAMAEEIHELSENALDIGEELDAISDDLADVEEFLFDDEYDDDDDDDDYFFGDFDDDDDDDECDGDECRCAFCGSADFPLNVECANCGAEIELAESDIVGGSVTCSACGEEFELDFDDGDEADELEI